MREDARRSGDGPDRPEPAQPPPLRGTGTLSHVDPATFSPRDHARSLGIALAYGVCFADFLHRPAA